MSFIVDSDKSIAAFCAAPHLSRLRLQTRGDANFNNRCSQRHPILPSHRHRACLKSEKPRPEPSPQLNSQHHQSQPTSLPRSEFAFVLTLVVTAAAGGPILAAWGVFFLILGNTTGTPQWLQALSTFLFASITDVLAYNWTTLSLDSGYTPFVVFFFATAAAVAYESFRIEQTVILPETSQIEHVEHTSSNDIEQFENWDDAFRETHKRSDTDH